MIDKTIAVLLIFALSIAVPMVLSVFKLVGALSVSWWLILSPLLITLVIIGYIVFLAFLMKPA